MGGHRVVPTGVEKGAHTEVLGHGQPGIGGGVLGDETDPPELRRAVGGMSAQHLDDPAVGARSPTASCSRVVLPAPFGPTSPTTFPSGMDRVQSESAQRRPYLLPRLEAPGPRSCHTFREAVPEGRAVDGLDVVGTESCRAGRANHLVIEARKRA